MVNVCQECGAKKPHHRSLCSKAPDSYRHRLAAAAAAVLGARRYRLTCPMCDFVFLAESGKYLCEPCREAYGPKNQQTKP